MSSDEHYSDVEAGGKYSNIWLNDKTFLQKFIRCYRDQRVLWDCNSPHYKDRKIRNIGLKNMVEVMHSINPDATALDVKRKINTLRSSYRRELNKVIESYKTSPQSPYRTSLWYYPLLTFLRADINRRDRVLGIKPKVEDSPCLPTSSQPKKRKAPVEIKMNRSEILPKLTKEDESHAKTAENNLDTLHNTAMIWASKLRNMPPMQRILAEKAMNEVIFQGELGALTLKGVQDISMTSTAVETETEPFEEYLEDFQTTECNFQANPI